MERFAGVMRWLVGVSLGLGLMVLLNQLQIPFYLYYPRVTHTVLISDSFDLYLFLISTVCVPGTLAIFSRKISKFELGGSLTVWAAALVLTILHVPYALAILYVAVLCVAVSSVSNSAELRRFAAAEILVPVLAVLVLIESAALYYWVVSAVNPRGQFGLLSGELELNLTFFLFPVGMLMMLVLLSSWLWVPVVLRFRELRSGTIVQDSSHAVGLNRRLVAVSLDFFMILAILVFFYPYLAGQGWIVGTDSYWRYLNPLNSLAGLAPSQAILTSYTHGLYVVLLYLIELASGLSAFSIVKFAPLILAFLSASAVFLAIHRGGWGFELAILSSICTLLWLPTTLGMYAGIQANWCVFVLWMLFLSFYLQTQEWSQVVFVFEALISLVIFLMHPWSWGVFLVSLMLTSLISRRSRWRMRGFQGVKAALVIALPVGMVAYLFIPGMRSDLGNTLELYAFSLIHPASLLSFGGALAELFYNWTAFLSPLLLLICLVGAYSLSDHGGIAKNYLLAWIAAWCLGSILTAPLAYVPANVGLSETQLWRMLYVSPLPILLALGMERCISLSKHFETPSGSEHVSRQQLLLSSALFVTLSLGLFVFEEPLVRAAIVLGAVAALLLVHTRFPGYQLTLILIVSLLVMILVNAGLRSLYPLLVDPHNLLNSFTR